MQTFLPLVFSFLLIILSGCNISEKKGEKNEPTLFVINNGGCENKDTLRIDSIGDHLVKDENGNIYFKTLAHPESGDPYVVLISRLYNACEGDSSDDLKNHIHVPSFRSLGDNYFGDQNHVFFYTEMADGGNIIETDAETTSFAALPNSFYGRDHNQVFYQGHLIPEADAQSFEVLYSISGKDSISTGGKDKNHAFQEGELFRN